VADVPVGTTTSVTTEGGGTGGGTGGTGGTGGGTTGGGTGGATGGGAGGTDGGTKVTTPSTVKKSGRSFAPLSDRGQIGVGTKAPRLGTPSGSNIAALQTPDEGFDEELNYGDGTNGGNGEDGLASIDYEDGAVGKGMAVPVATGFVFAAWAFHLRYLARAAKPAKARPRYSR
jgi:hypothetical protein